MLLFTLILCIEGLQLQLQPFEYKKGRNTDVAYTTIVQISGSQYQMIIDNNNPYSWVYAKNPINGQLCLNCPQDIEIFDCSNVSGCKVKQESEITLSNSNKCILSENSLILDNQTFEKFELCLVYQVTNIEFKVNGALSLIPNQSALFNQLVQKQMQQNFQVNINQQRLFVSETSPYSIQKPTLFQNQGLNEWKLQFQLFQRDKQFLTKIDNAFINVDLTTKYLWLTEDIITKLIKEIKDYDDLFCSIEKSRLMCLCSQSDFINKIPKVKIGFNGLSDKFSLPLNPVFIKEHQKCQLDVFKADKSVLGNQFFKLNGAIFDQQKNAILIGQSNQDQEQPLKFNFAIVFCIIAGLLMIFGLVALIQIISTISEEQLSAPKYYQDKAKPLFVLSKREFKPINLELSTNKQMVYQKRK